MMVCLAGVLSYCIAPTHRHAMCAQLIVGSNINVNTCDVRGIPLLVHACEMAHENEEICLMMLQKGADPTKKDVVSFIENVVVVFVENLRTVYVTMHTMHIIKK